MYRIDCMTRKINVNFYHYIRENHKRLNLTEELVEFFRNNIRYTSRNKFLEIDKKYPYFKEIYDEYLKSDRFKKLILNIKLKYDDEYLKLFFRHSRNFLNFYLKDSKNSKDKRDYTSSLNEENISDKDLNDDSIDSNDSFENEDNMYVDEMTEEKRI